MRCSHATRSITWTRSTIWVKLRRARARHRNRIKLRHTCIVHSIRRCWFFFSKQTLLVSKTTTTKHTNAQNEINTLYSTSVNTRTAIWNTPHSPIKTSNFEVYFVNAIIIPRKSNDEWPRFSLFHGDARVLIGWRCDDVTRRWLVTASLRTFAGACSLLFLRFFII